MTLRHVMLGFFVTSSLFLYSCEKDSNEEATETENINETDRQFVIKASSGNQAEIELGQLAATKGNHPAVKQYGQMMVTDHTAVGAELNSIEQDINLTAPDTLDAEHRTLKQVLSTLEGRMFDSTYIASQIKDHQVAIALYEQEKANGANTKLKNFAAKHLPHLQMHLQKADSIKNVIR